MVVRSSVEGVLAELAESRRTPAPARVSANSLETVSNSETIAYNCEIMFHH